jgi:hypothetical protein
MTYLRSVPSDLDHEAFQRPRYGALMPLRRPQADRVCSSVICAILFFAHGLVATLLRCGQDDSAAQSLGGLPYARVRRQALIRNLEETR